MLNYSEKDVSKNENGIRELRVWVNDDYLGRSHGQLRPYGMNSHFWEKLGECIIDVVLSQEAVRDLPGAAQAWVIFTACLVDQVNKWRTYQQTLKNS